MAQISRYDEFNYVIVGIQKCARNGPFTLEEVRVASRGVIVGKVREYITLLTDSGYLKIHKPGSPGRGNATRWVIALPDELGETTFEHCKGIALNKLRKVSDAVTEKIQQVAACQETDPAELEPPAPEQPKTEQPVILECKRSEPEPETYPEPEIDYISLLEIVDGFRRVILKSWAAHGQEQRIAQLEADKAKLKEDNDRLELSNMELQDKLDTIKKKLFEEQ